MHVNDLLKLPTESQQLIKTIESVLPSGYYTYLDYDEGGTCHLCIGKLKYPPVEMLDDVTPDIIGLFPLID